MNPVLILFLLLLTLIGCSDSKKMKNQKAIETQEKVSLDNPSLFLGSTFGEFLQMNHKLGNYHRMLQFTCSQTRERYSDSVLIYFYKNMQFSYSLELRSLKEDKELVTLFYRTSIQATEKTIKMKVAVEDDTVRLFLDKLDLDCPFVGN